jgi:hypothetical protein
MLAQGVMSGKYKLKGLSADERFGSLEEAIGRIIAKTEAGKKLAALSLQKSLQKAYRLQGW